MIDVVAQYELVGHSSWLTSVAYSAGGQLIATGSNDRTARLWDSNARLPRLTLTGHRGIVYAVAFSADGQHLATASSDGAVRIWNTDNGICEGVIECDAAASGVSFCSDDKQLVVGEVNGNVSVWDWRALLRIAQAPSEARWMQVACAPDGHAFATGGSDGRILMRSMTCEMLSTLRGDGSPVLSLCWSRDGAFLASGGVDNRVYIWSRVTGILLHRLSGHAYHVRALCFTPSGQAVASGSEDGTIRIWGLVDGMPKLVLDSLGRSPVRGVAFSPSGSVLASAGHDGVLRLWEFEATDGPW